MPRRLERSIPPVARPAGSPTRAVILFMLAVAGARVAFVFATRADPVFRAPDLDEAFYHVWARSLAENRGDFQGPYFLGPLYPYVVSFLYRIFGPEVFGVRLVQTGLGVLDVGLVLLLGRRLFGSAAGFAGATLLSLYGPLAFYEGLLLVEVLLLSLVLGALCILVLPRWNPVVRGVLVGALLGLAALGRATALLCVPVALLGLWREGRVARRQPVGALLVCLLGCLLVLAPVAVRNSRHGGGLVLTTNGGVNFYAGNFEGANGRFREPPGVQFFRDPALPTADPRAPLPPQVAERALTVVAAAGTERAADSSVWLHLAWDWIRTHPVDFLVLEIRKAWLLLQEQEVTHLESFAFHRERLAALRFFVVGFSWILPFALLGGWCAGRQRILGAGLAAGFMVALLLPALLFFVTSRYRLAAVPELALFAGFGVATVGQWLRARAWKRVALGTAFLLPVFVLSRTAGAPPPGELAWQHSQMAFRLSALGDLEAAIRSQERAAQLLPHDARPRVELARYLNERRAVGDLERAESLLRDAAVQLPERPDVPFLLGLVLVRQGRTEEARAAWQRALAIDPGFAPARARLREGAPR